MKLSDFVMRYLRDAGVKVIFGYQGGSITHLIESMSFAEIEYIQTYNEQGAAMAADAYARINENGLGVAIASNGPGATNLITGIANAYCDSVPTLFMTGQVHTWAMKKDKQIRQKSFQEIDIISIVKPITKYAVTVMKPNEIRFELEKAIHIAKQGRKGPVLLDIPVDIQGTDIEPEWLTGYSSGAEHDIEYRSQNDYSECINLLRKAKRPVVLVGGGANSRQAKYCIRRFSEKYHIPVVCSLQGLDVMNHDSKEFIGFIGSFGNRYANLVVHNSDLVLVLGSRLDMRQTGKNAEKFTERATIIHVDIDENELNHNVNETLSYSGSCESILSFLIENFEREEGFTCWLDLCNEWKQRYTESLPINQFISSVGQSIADSTIVISDVGQNQMWVAQSLRIKGECIRMLNSGGLGAMGYSLPGAIGACIGSDYSKCVALMGDGGIQMNIQELCLIGQRQLPIIIIVLNNHALGLIRDIHEKYYNNHCIGSVEGFTQPQFKMMAAAYNIQYYQVDESASEKEIKDILACEGPCLVDVHMLGNTYVNPELIGMDALDNQTPYLEKIEKLRITKEVEKNDN
ncbi:MAG: thiamine pyrophosphate-binding protein [bacterium]|nr:thiamine pyrophosphate-binding protein [bacterium]